MIIPNLGIDANQNCSNLGEIEVPPSLENEDVVVQLDRTLLDLVNFIEKTVGLKNTLIVLASDHGMADMPEYMTGLGYKAGRLDPGKIVKVANEVGEKFGVKEIVRFFYRPYLYLDEEKIAETEADRNLIKQAIAAFLGISPSGAARDLFLRR